MTHPEMSDGQLRQWLTELAMCETADRAIVRFRAVLSEGTASLIAENERLRADVDRWKAVAALDTKAYETMRNGKLLALDEAIAERDQLSTQLRACERERDSFREKLLSERERFDALRTTLEIIGCSESENPVADATETLVSAGIWIGTPTPGKEETA